VPGARLYRTGDRARLLPDGSLAFLGRHDDEVIIRGRRVDLEEITAALGAHPGVAAAAVVAAATGGGERELIAYVVPAPGAALSRASLARKLRRRLPGHMMPGVYVLVPALPLTTNGKVDRTALPAPDDRNTLRAPERLVRAA
jgi:acyl-coenzyme A synthetase/AMP-(fatty) acid ligase